MALKNQSSPSLTGDLLFVPTIQKKSVDWLPLEQIEHDGCRQIIQ
jgi:hypothetical protein